MHFRDLYNPTDAQKSEFVASNPIVHTEKSPKNEQKELLRCEYNKRFKSEMTDNPQKYYHKWF